MVLKDRLNYFQELIACSHSLYSWQYTADGQLISSSCPPQKENFYNLVYEISDSKEHIQAQIKTQFNPMILSSMFGLVWVIDIDRSNKNQEVIHVLGPLLEMEITPDAMRAMFKPAEKFIPLSAKTDLVELFCSLPVIPFSVFSQYAVMLHYTLTGEHIRVSSIFFQSNFPPKAPYYDSTSSDLNYLDAWQNEQDLMNVIMQGNLNYEKALSTASIMVFKRHFFLSNPLRSSQDMSITLIAHCTHAAILGGLSPERAYALQDKYVNSVESCKGVSMLAALNRTMFEDFVMRVRDCKTDSQSMSTLIRSCREYVQIHASEKLEIESIAEHFNYTGYYLSRRFKQETGSSINDYIQSIKIEMAKSLLSDSHIPIHDIFDRLNFSSHSHFSKIFRKLIGITPTEYRVQNQKL